MNDAVRSDAWLSQIAEHARSRRALVATAESLTAGMISARLCSVSGASQWFRGGIVSYATELKAQLLKVDEKLLAAQGPVCAEVAAQMARGACSVLGANWALSATGLAGPLPDRISKEPVGTVFIGLCTPGGTKVHRFSFSGTREDVRARTAAEALRLLAEALA